MNESILIDNADRPTGDMLAELFKEGAMDPSHLPPHPCPPGKKDDTMRTDLMDFQVRFRVRSRSALRLTLLYRNAEARPRLDDQHGAPSAAQDH